MRPKVSVILPCFNSINYIKETLDSVFNQSYSHLEIIVIDDGSTDGSYEYLMGLKNDNLTVKKNPKKGACAARNFGFKLSTGDFIQFLDADDLLSLDKIEKQVLLLQQDSDKIAVCGTKNFFDSPEVGAVIDLDFLYSTNSPAAFLLNLYGAKGILGMIQTNAWLTPRNSILKAGLWNETLLKDQDGEFFCRVVMASSGVLYEPNVINFYRQHIGGKNISSGKQRINVQSQLDALVSKENNLSIVKDTVEFKKAMALQYKFIAIEAWPEFKDISALTLQKSKDYGGSDYVPVLGGEIIELMKSLLGWKAAKSFKNWIHKNLTYFKIFTLNEK